MKETDINYKDLFEHVKNLRKVVLLGGAGRVGLDFFHSLLEGHPEILQVTGPWFFHRWWKKEARCKENLSDLINEFIWHACDGWCNHIAKFKSYYNKLDRWDQLGTNKNESFQVDIDIFKNHMLGILANKKVNSINFFLAINMAYGLTIGLDIKKTKILFYHIHHITKLGDFKEDFRDFDVISGIREPRNSLVSSVEHWKRYSSEKCNSSILYQFINNLFRESEPVLQYTKNCKTSKLENLHLYPQEVLGEFCKTYGLKLEDSCFESSYHGKKWWGDAVSGRYLDGFNKNINNKNWKGKFFFHDNFLIEFILEERLRHYGYPIENKISKFYLFFAIFLIFLPMKYELKVFTYNFRKGRTAKDRIRAVYKATYFYLRRVFLYFSFIWKKIRKKIFLAQFFAQGKTLKQARED